MEEKFDRIEQQIVELDSPIDRLWWFAQLERSVENSDKYEPIVGSSDVLDRIMLLRSPMSDKDMFKFQYEIKKLDVIEMAEKYG